MQLYNMIKSELSMLFRVPIALFFNNVFPILMMVIIVGSSKNIDLGYYDLKFIDTYIFIALALSILPLTLISIPSGISVSIYGGFTQRYNLFYITTRKIFISKIIASLIMCLMQFIIIMLFAYIVYDMSITSVGVVVAILVNYLILYFALLLTGVVIGALAKKMEIAQAIGMPLMFLMLILSGGMGNINFEGFLNNLSNLLPTKYFMKNGIDVMAGQNFFIEDFILPTMIWIVVFTLVVIIITKKKKI